MFTGIVETTGKILSLIREKENLCFSVSAPFANELQKGQSVAHNGVCLTVEKISPSKKNYTVRAVKETLSRTNFGLLKKGSIVNLERSLKIGDRLDGHFVQGHVDTTATCIDIAKQKGSWILMFKVQSSKLKVQNLIIEKGSICINGISLTIVQANQNVFSVAVIPHTFKRTNFSSLKKGDTVNIEFDMLGKYIREILSPGK